MSIEYSSEDKILQCSNRHQWIGRERFLKDTCPICGATVLSSSSCPLDRSKLIYCIICGAPEYPEKYSSAKELRKSNRCFTCEFWMEYVNKRINLTPNHFVIAGNYYIVQPDSNNNIRLCGFGGREFKIKPNDNSPIIITHNLWHQGDVPERFRDILNDNAIFI